MLKAVRLPVLCFLSFCLAFADAPMTAKEYANQARVNEPVSGGIAFVKSQVTNLGALSLFNASGAEVPAQFSSLSRFESGSYQWVLADFLDNFSAGEEKSYTVRQQAPSASVTNPLTVSRSGNVITIRNGIISFSFDTVDFRGIQALSFNGTSLISGTTGGLTITDTVHGMAAVNNGPVTRAGFIYQGPVRATYRVEGEFFRDSCGGLGYSYMMTAYANSPRIKLEIQVRNSTNPACGRWAMIRGAASVFPLAFTPSNAVAVDTVFVNFYGMQFDTSRGVRAYENGNAGIVFVDRWAGGFYPNYLGNVYLQGNAATVDVIKRRGSWFGYTGRDYDSGSTYIAMPDTTYKLPDMCHKNSEIYIECYTGTRSVSQLAALAASLKGKMVLRPDPAYLSSTGALSAGRFGTLEDEIASYRKWGWTFADNQKPASAPRPNAFMASSDIHGENETDDAEGMMLQWVRTGQRGFFDDGEAWARYYKTNYAFRSVGWEDQGQYFTAAYVSTYATRKDKPVAGAPGYYSDWGVGRVDVEAWVGCHFFGEGLLDYYCLTGDIDALEGAIDLGETAWLFHTNTNRGDTLNASGGGDRATGRQLLHIVRLYEVLRDSTWFYRANLRAKLVIRSKSRDPRGVITGDPALWSNWDEDMTAMRNFPDSLKQFVTANAITLDFNANRTPNTYVVRGAERWPYKEVGGSWEQTYCQTAVDRFYKATGDEDGRDYVIGFAQYGVKVLPFRSGIVPYRLGLDYPLKGRLFGDNGYCDWDTSHNKCVLPSGEPNHSTVSGSLGSHNGWYTVYYPSPAALGYRYTGFSYLMKGAYRFWDLGGKRGYWTTLYAKPELEVYRFAWHTPPKDDGLINTVQLFYEAVHHTDTVPPSAITDLAVARTAGNAGLAFTWSAPAGGAVEYQLKYFKDRPIVDYLDFNYATDDTVKAPWWYALNAPGEPSPQASGSLENYTLNKSLPDTETWYAAVCSRDTAGNLSLLSNVLKIDNTIAVENADRFAAKNGFTFFPSPFNPAVTIRYWTRPLDADKVSLRIFNAAGALIREFKAEGTRRGGTRFLVWDGRNAAGKMAPSGVYFIKMNAGRDMLVKKIVMAK